MSCVDKEKKNVWVGMVGVSADLKTYVVTYNDIKISWFAQIN